jgi:hypothetical protein
VAGAIAPVRWVLVARVNDKEGVESSGRARTTPHQSYRSPTLVLSFAQETEPLRKAIKSLLGRDHLPSFGLHDSFIEFCTLLKRRSGTEGAHESRLVELLRDFALLYGSRVLNNSMI